MTDSLATKTQSKYPLLFRWFIQCINELGTVHFQEPFENIQDTYFVDFMKRGMDLENRLYNLCDDYKKLTKMVSDVMTEDSKLNLVLFKDAIKVHLPLF